MRGVTAVAVCALAAGAVALEGRQQASPQQPVFRGTIDVIRLDVSVLDKNRRPVRGLTDKDFAVYEDGKRQQIVAVSAIDAAANDPALTAWMRYTPRDIGTNDLADEIGDGRVFAIVMDDGNIPYDATELIQSAREIARYLVTAMRPSDTAMIVFPQQAGDTLDLTNDRGTLMAAIDRFQPQRIDWLEPTPRGAGNGGGDMPYRYSSALARSTCERSQPVVPTLETITARLAAIPNRRKTIVLVSPGAPVPLYESSSRDQCPTKLHDIMQDVFHKAQRGNINIYGVDPGGTFGYTDYLNDPIRSARRIGSPDRGGPPPAPRATTWTAGHEFLRIASESTGGRAVTGNDVWDGLDDLLAEADSYYLVGYQTSNPVLDGKFRKVEVKVDRPGVTVRTRSGYYAQRAGTLATQEQKITPSANNLGLAGLSSPASLPLRVAAVPMGRVPNRAEAEVAVVLTVRLPAPLQDLPETLTVVRNVYDEASRPGPPVVEKTSLTLHPTAGDVLRYDVEQRLTLAPGRYQIRFNATSTALDESGSVYADVSVPDFSKPLTVTPIVLGTPPASALPRPELLADLLPVDPTTARDFASNDHVVALVRVFEAGASSRAPVTIATRILDGANVTQLDTSATLAPEAFDIAHGATFQLPLPLERLSHGPYLLSVTATVPGGPGTRRDLVFHMR